MAASYRGISRVLRDVAIIHCIVWPNGITNYHMKKFLRTCLSLTLISSGFCNDVRDDPIDVSIIRLVAAPKDYAQKVVRIVGYLNIGVEGDAIYLHEEDFKQSLTPNGLALQAKPQMLKQLEKINRQYVIIEGMFDPADTGHMRLFSGGIRDITRADAWKPGAENASPK
jgi:hypothetical protein